MPVQINEVIIRTVVDTPAPSSSGESRPATTTISDEAIAELILEIINEQSER